MRPWTARAPFRAADPGLVPVFRPASKRFRGRVSPIRVLPLTSRPPAPPPLPAWPQEHAMRSLAGFSATRAFAELSRPDPGPRRPCRRRAVSPGRTPRGLELARSWTGKWSVAGSPAPIWPPVAAILSSPISSSGPHSRMKWEKIVVQPTNMEFRGTTRLKGAVLTLLSVLAVGQVVTLERRTPRLDTVDPPVTVAHDVSELVVRDSGGATIELGAPYETLLLVFDPDCAHSARVAETWESWLTKQDSGRLRTYAVSSGPLPAAVRYARDMRWNVRVGSVGASGGEHPLTRRTPWVFAVGADGRVVAEGHGSRLAEVARNIGGRGGQE